MLRRKRNLVVGMAAILLLILPSYAYELAVLGDSTCITYSPFSECEGPSTHGCASTNFYVEHGGSYTLTASIDGCGGGACRSCVSEAYVYEGTTLIGCVHSGCCGEESIGVPLESGHTYTLYSCLLPCGNANCGTDCANCPARASVHA